jgi:hypothetical protein
VTIELSSTDKRDGKALALFARCAEWQTGRTKDGRPFFAIPGSERGLLHMADQRDCSCQDRQRSRNVCKHMRAVRFWMAAFATGAVAPKPRPGATAVDDADDFAVLTPEGATYLAVQCETDADLGLASEAEIDVAFAGVAADAQARRDAERRLRPPITCNDDLFPDDGSDFDPIGVAQLRYEHHVLLTGE